MFLNSERFNDTIKTSKIKKLKQKTKTKIYCLLPVTPTAQPNTKFWHLILHLVIIFFGIGANNRL